LSDGRPAIDVCVATYKRPQLLARLLESLINQETAGEFTYRIIVADNDADGSAAPIVERFRARGPEILYAIEPEQSVSLARNKSISLATAPAIATTATICMRARWLRIRGWRPTPRTCPRPVAGFPWRRRRTSTRV
jgi:hypothetical protein